MTYMDEGIYGAKRVSWEDSYRKVLRRIVNQNPRAGDWFEEFCKQCKEDDDIEMSVYRYAYTNGLLALKAENASRSPKLSVKAVRAETAKEIAAVTTTVRAELLLNLIMVNGKRLGDCTGAECRTFQGWYSRIAKLVPPRKRVADVLSEARVAALWKQSQK